MLTDWWHRHAYRPRRGGESRLEARRRAARLGRSCFARLLRSRTAADCSAQCRSRNTVVSRHRQHPRMARYGSESGVAEQSAALALRPGAFEAALLLRAFTYLHSRRYAGAG